MESKHIQSTLDPWCRFKSPSLPSLITSMNKGEFFSFLKTAFMDVLEQKQKCIQLIKHMMFAVRLSNPTLTALPLEKLCYACYHADSVTLIKQSLYENSHQRKPVRAPSIFCGPPLSPGHISRPIHMHTSPS